MRLREKTRLREAEREDAKKRMRLRERLREVRGWEREDEADRKTEAEQRG